MEKLAPKTEDEFFREVRREHAADRLLYLVDQCQQKEHCDREYESRPAREFADERNKSPEWHRERPVSNHAVNHDLHRKRRQKHYGRHDEAQSEQAHEMRPVRTPQAQQPPINCPRTHKMLIVEMLMRRSSTIARWPRCA